ncbi:MAG: 4a-hydroxytetrahydrobiopterin dehydratase [Chloroflexi bacterium]|nr:4a-hydroxytetrahydrobiopterin dehydratase [Chloroflexota bacterium]
MAQKFSAGEVAATLRELPGWAADGDTIKRQFKFPDHIAAMGFVVRVAMAAEAMDHHPDLRIVYNTVDIVLSSHDAGGVTARDAALAKKISALA